MSDDTPLEPISPEPTVPAEGAPSAPTETATQTQESPVAATPTTPAAEAPTQPVAGTTPTGPPPWGQPPSDSDTPGTPRGNTVAVPKWVLAVAGALVVALIGFGIGYAVAPGGDSDSSATNVVPNNPFGGNGNLNPGGNGGLNPNGNGNGGGNGNGNGGGLPTIPDQGNLQGGFLGVVSTSSTDPAGARVTQVVSDSPAGDAGLQEDDVITKVDGDAVTTPAELARRIQAKDSGDSVTITYVRDGDTKTTDVKLISRRDGLQQSTPSTTTPGQ